VGVHEARPATDAGAGHGRPIVNCSSLGGLVGLPDRASYHASKHGVLGLIKSAALEYAPRGVRINAVCPGTIDTPMVARMIEKGELDMAEEIENQPIGRLGHADEIAEAVLWLCSRASSFVIGVALPVDGGYTATQREHCRSTAHAGSIVAEHSGALQFVLGVQPTISDAGCCLH
jgi:NAD(P)-dependent dehydrogenase (short-subunit alcohol dehydrogenase family)